jgi:hypothetical protein
MSNLIHLSLPLNYLQAADFAQVYYLSFAFKSKALSIHCIISDIQNFADGTKKNTADVRQGENIKQCM